MIPQSRKWVPVVEATLALIVWGLGFGAGKLFFHSSPPKVVTHHVFRQGVANGIGFAAVRANFTGPPVGTVRLPELTGYRCGVWVENPARTAPSKWVDLLCKEQS